jgi:anthranilate synthase
MTRINKQIIIHLYIDFDVHINYSCLPLSLYKGLGMSNKEQLGSNDYITKHGINILCDMLKLSYKDGIKSIISSLDQTLGVILASNFEYPGKYTRFDIGFINPPIQFVANLKFFRVKALNERGRIILSMITSEITKLEDVTCNLIDSSLLEGKILYSKEKFPEEARSKQPSVFSVLRAIIGLFSSKQDEYLGLYGAFGYDLTFQFEKINLKLPRSEKQRDIVLYLPDQLILVDHRKEIATQYSYDFEFNTASTKSIPRDGIISNYMPDNSAKRYSDHNPGEYAEIVRTAKDYFKRGDLFEVVPGQTFSDSCLEKPSEVFLRLREKNPSPYSFFMNLGESEYLVGASPEMYVRVTGRRVESCPISGTIIRGKDALEDADNILKLLNSTKDESELTMCTDVDRNDKSRICEPGSVKVVGRRQLELYSRLIHTVDHVEGTLRDGYDAIDAFLTHTWAVTVTGAPKTWAMQFLEDHEKSPRMWYGGAVGCLGFDGNMNTGLTIRTVRIKDGVSHVRVGATLLYDSVPEDEEQETILKASALLDALNNTSSKFSSSVETNSILEKIGSNKRALLVDHEDSFVHTLSNYFRQTGMDVITLRSGFSENELKEMNPDLVVLSPGPGKPSDFNVSNTINMCINLGIPLFGVCLGLQAIVEYFGGELSVLDYPMHGKKVKIIGAKGELFAGLPKDGFQVGVYHSLYSNKSTFPKVLNLLAESELGIAMAIEHKTLPIWAVQFHPESILSLGEKVGFKIIENVVSFLTTK